MNCIFTENVTLPQIFFKHFTSKNQLPGFYITGTLVENGWNPSYINKSTKFLSDKFDDYDNEKKEIIRELQYNLKVMENKLNMLGKRTNWQEQCSGPNCILIYGVPEK